MATYVICASCGARIKAGRDRCLRCDEPLVAAKPAPAPANERERWVIAGGVGAAIVAVLAIAAWAGAGREVDAVARPAPGSLIPSSKPAKVEASKGAEPRPAESSDVVPVTPADSARTGMAAVTTGDLDTAVAGFDEALKKAPNDPDLLNKAGLVLERLNRTAEAAERFARAVEIAPDTWAYHFNLAHALGAQGKWEASVAEYRTATRLFPTDYATQFNLALALHKQGAEEAAVAEYQKAIELAPGEPSFHLPLAVSLEKLGRTADARQEFEKYLELSPDAGDAPKVKAHLQALGAPRRSPDAALTDPNPSRTIDIVR